jgi:hypothetical protein
VAVPDGLGSRPAEGRADGTGLPAAYEAGASINLAAWKAELLTMVDSHLGRTALAFAEQLAVAEQETARHLRQMTYALAAATLAAIAATILAVLVGLS